MSIKKKKLEMCLFLDVHIGDACSKEAESSDIQFACRFGILYKED